MRKDGFFSVQSKVTAPVDTDEHEEVDSIDLNARLSQSPVPNKPESEQEEEEQEPEVVKTSNPEPGKQKQKAANTNSAVEFDEGYEPGQGATEEEDNEPGPTTFDPRGLAYTLVNLFDFIRTTVYPWGYEKLMFPDEWERMALKEAKKKFRDALIQDEEAELNKFEKYLLKKEEKLISLNLKVPFKEKEKKMLSDALAKHIKKIDWMAKLEKYDWVMILITFEGFRFYEVHKTSKEYRYEP